MKRKTHILLLIFSFFISKSSFAQWSDLHQNFRSDSLLQSIVEAVNIDNIYQTERHLTGEEPFWLHGQLDSILSRYSYSDGIVKAQNYLQNRFLWTVGSIGSLFCSFENI